MRLREEKRDEERRRETKSERKKEGVREGSAMEQKGIKEGEDRLKE